MKNQFGNYRCVICNSVSHGEIADDYGEFNSKPFYPDRHTDGFLCFDCHEASREAMEDWDIEEDQDLEDLLDEE